MATIINPAPGGPGDLPAWTRADKDGVGTAHSWASPVWFTVAGGIITEVYYPDVDTPQVRDFQLIITDGSTFFHDAQSDFTHQCDLVPHEPSSLEIWNFDRQLQTMQAGKRLRIPLKIAFSLRWSVDNWSTFTDTQSVETAVGIYYVDLPTNRNDAGSLVQFTFYWTDSQRWEGENYSVRLSLR